MSNEIKKLSGKFRVYKESGTDTSPLKAITRTRESLVCNRCRRSKLRCDRQKPCHSCLKRGESALCSYEGDLKYTNGSQHTSIAEDRLERLESLVKQLIHNQEAHSIHNHSEDTETNSLTSPPLMLEDFYNPSPKHAPENVGYVGATHWSSVLEDIHEIQLAMNDFLVSRKTNTKDRTLLLGMDNEPIFGAAEEIAFEDVLEQYLPPRANIDRYLSLYFNGETYIIPLIHAPSFQRQYQQFWDNQEDTNPLWVSILFSICYRASVIGGTTDSYKSSQNADVTGDLSLHTAAAKCLVIGQYYKTQSYAVEALAMYGYGKTLQSLDPCREAGTIFSMVVRLAYEMGYHRDPDSFASFTPFEAEMRRRCWACFKQMDLMISFQLGLPSNILLENCDPKSPRNLLDSDFDSDTTVLPPSRSENEATPLLWFIVKDRLIVGFSKVWREVLSFGERSDAEINQLDRDIRVQHASIPDILRARSVTQSITDPPVLIITRMYMEFIVLKSICVLHRRYMARGRPGSIHACVEAAHKIVSRFIDMYKEFAPGGQLQDKRWMLTNFTINDFCLGVMVLCLFVHLSRKRGDAFMRNAPISDKAALEMLRESLTICVTKLRASKDAQRVAEAVRLVLRDNLFISSSRHDGVQPPIPVPTPSSTAANNSVPGNPQCMDEQFPTFDLDDSRSQEEAFGVLDPFNFMGNDFDGFDWEDMDTTIANLDSSDNHVTSQ